MEIAGPFTARQARSLAGFRNVYMIDYLARSGVVRPSVAANPGRGRRRLYSFADVVLLRALNRLLERGIPVRGLKNAQATYKRLHKDVKAGQLPARYLITDGDRVLYIESPSQIVDLTNDGQLAFAFVVDMLPINDEVLTQHRKMFG